MRGPVDPENQGLKTKVAIHLVFAFVVMVLTFIDIARGLVA
jgi:hypothetical protein